VPGALVIPKVTVEPFTSNIDGASFGYGDREQIRSPFPGRLVASPAGTLRSFNLKSKAGSVTAFASTRRAHGLRYSAVLSRRSCACAPAQFRPSRVAAQSEIVQDENTNQVVAGRRSFSGFHRLYWMWGTTSKAASSATLKLTHAVPRRFGKWQSDQFSGRHKLWNDLQCKF
jgi:hypothetical protein